MPRVPDSYLEARRRGILRAAQRCFSRKGLRAATMRDICRAANLSPGAVYRYFGGKREILEALARAQASRTLTFVESLAEPAPPAGRFEEAVSALLRALDAPGTEEGLRFDLLLAGGALADDSLAEILDQGYRRLEGALAVLAEKDRGDGRLDRSADPELLARLAAGLFHGLAARKAADPKTAVKPLVALAGSLSSPR